MLKKSEPGVGSILSRSPRTTVTAPIDRKMAPARSFEVVDLAHLGAYHLPPQRPLDHVAPVHEQPRHEEREHHACDVSYPDHHSAEGGRRQSRKDQDSRKDRRAAGARHPGEDPKRKDCRDRRPPQVDVRVEHRDQLDPEEGSRAQKEHEEAPDDEQDGVVQGDEGREGVHSRGYGEQCGSHPEGEYERHT